ncbi:ubiquitin carboxyl-terminal hydrolase 47-like [Cebidichthys violaceus]|uniref:ubiquitin carboxyl-terminal hydrolase 47-like n=1 Tax=Cebidichthys violaceus TaxID=271503 RepID=UPI0035CB50E6
MNHDLVEMFREKLDNFTISDYHGLNSPGLTCYLNSVLQVLFMTEDFREAVERCCREDSPTIDPQLRRLFADLQKSTAKTEYVTKTLGITNVYEQRDAAEYFEKILGLTSPEAAKIFKGELGHRTTCLKCKERNNSRGFFWILPLAVEDVRRQTYSVENGLKAFFKGEKVCGDNKVYCNRCNKKRDADFECEMTQSPEIMTLLLKRFSFDYKLRCYVKLHRNVDVPKSLDIESCKYDLYALVNHFGTLTGGHYTAQIKSFETHAWYHFNDDIVNRVTPPLFGAGNNSLRSRTAYLLMYRKVSRHTEKLHEGNQQSVCTHADVDAEGRRDEAERGEALVPDLLKDESCNGGGNLKRLNVDELKKSHDDTVWKKQTNFSWEPNEQRDPRAACVRPHKEMLLQTCTGADGEDYRTSGQTQKSNFAKLQKDGNDSSLTRNRVKPADANVFKTKREAVTEVKENRAEQKREACVSANVCDSALKSLPYLTRDLQQLFRIHKLVGLGFSPNKCLKSISPKRDKEKRQHFVTADGSCRLATTQTVKRGETTASVRRKAAESRDTLKKRPWR